MSSCSKATLLYIHITNLNLSICFKVNNATARVQTKKLTTTVTGGKQINFSFDFFDNWHF